MPNSNHQDPLPTHLAGVKRARVAKSCTVCRQKKIKCDQSRPACGTCVKKQRAQYCKYEEPEWTVDTVLKVEHSTAGNNGNKHSAGDSNYHVPNQDQDATIIDFYKNNYGSPRMITQGVLNWVTLLKKDVYLNAIVQCSRNEKVLMTTKPKEKTIKEREFVSRYKNQDLDVDLHTASLNTTPQSANNDIISSIHETLNDLKLVWILVDKFFNSELYCFLPILDRQDFKFQLSQIIGVQGDPTAKVNITKRIELSIIGSLLIIMRLSSLSLYNAQRFDITKLSSTDLYIHDNPVKNNVISLSTKCLNEVCDFRDAKLEIFQLELLLRYYSLLSPEDSDCVSLTCTKTMGPLIHSAMINGLNRDPTIAHPNHNNPNLLRRLWFKVLNLDYHQIILTGVPPMINDRFFDTKPPELDSNSSALEYYINEKLHEANKLHDLLKPLMNLVLDVKEKPKFSLVLHHLTPLENYVQNHMKIDDILKMSSDTVLQRLEKISRIISFIDTVSVLYMIYYHFFLFYNENQDSKNSFHYLIKLIRLMTLCTPLARFLMDSETGGIEYDLHHHFGVGIIIIPKIELHLHKCIQLVFSILARIKDLQMRYPARPVDSINQTCLKITAIVLKAVLNISDLYYHAWSIHKMHEFIIKTVLKKNLDASKTQIINERFLKLLNETNGSDDIFHKYTDSDFEKLDDEINELANSFKDGDKSPGSIDLNFNNDGKHDMMWVDQFQVQTGGLDDGMDSMFDIDSFDLDRFIYQSYGN